MKRILAYLPCILAAAGSAAFAWVLAREIESMRAALETWAERDLSARTELAADALAGVLAEGDVAKVGEFAAARKGNGLRLTVLTERGGMVFDTEPSAAGSHATRPEVKAAAEAGSASAIRRSAASGKKMLFAARKCGEGHIVRLGLPYATVVEPLRRGRGALLLAGFAGASGVMLAVLFTLRLAARNRELSRAKERQARMLEDMKRVADFRRDFVANVSHEFKTPLTGILGATEMLCSPGAEELAPEDRAELLAMLKREAVRLDSLSRDILSLAALEHGEEEARAKFETADVAALAAEAVAAAKPRAEAAGAEISLRAPERLELRCSPKLVEQAIVNLAENAAAHSGSATIEVEVEETEDGARVAVADRGRGMNAAEAERAFERFWRADGSRGRRSGGTGLGLAIVRQIARLHGGDAEVEAKEGEGCRFSFTLKTKEKGPQR